MAVVDELVALLGYKLEGAENADRFVKSLDGIEKKAIAVAQTLGRVSAAAGGALAAGLGFLGKSVIDTAAKFETYKATLETIEGSVAGAERALDWVADFARTTPYEVDELTRAFVKLRSYGLDPMDGSMTVLGDTASGMGKSMDQVVEAFADATTFQFERLRELGIVASQAGDEVTFSWTENGESMNRTIKKTSANVTEFLNEVWGRKFSGAMLRQSKTWTGMLSNLGDSWVDFQRRIGDAGFFDTVKDRLAGVLDQVARWDEDGTIDRIANTLSDLFITVANAIGVLADRIGTHVSFISENFEALEPWLDKIKWVFMALIASAFPLMTAFVLLGLAVDDLLTYFEGGESVIGGFVDWLRAIIPATGEVEDAIVNMALAVAAGLAAAFILAPKAMAGMLVKGIAGLLAPLLQGVGFLIGTLGRAVLAVFPSLGTALLAGLRVALGVLTGPVGWAMLAISAGLLIWQFWDQIVAAWDIVSGLAGDLFASAAEWFAGMDFGGQAIALMNSLWQGLQAAWAGVSASAATMFASAVEWWTGIDWGQVGRDAAYAAVSGLLAMIFASATTVIHAWQRVADWIKSIDWAGVGKAIVDFVVNAFSTLGQGILDAFNAARDLVMNIDWGAVATAAVTAYVNIWKGIAALIAGAIQGTGQAITDEVKSWFNIDLAEIGAQLGQTLLNGLNTAGENIRNTVRSWFGIGPEVLTPVVTTPQNKAVIDAYSTPTRPGNDNWLTQAGQSAKNFADNNAKLQAGQGGAPIVNDNSQQTSNQTNNVTVNQTVQQATDAPAAAANATANAVVQAAPQPPRMNRGSF